MNTKKFNLFKHTSLNCILFTLLIFLAIIPNTAAAENNCNKLEKNEEWKTGMTTLVQTMQANDMKLAKQQAKALSKICSDSPSLNYLQGKIAEALDEKNEALYFYQKASENTYAFAVDPETAKKIWYARYENEHPERTQDAILSKDEQFKALNANLKQAESDKAQYFKELNTLKESELSTTKSLMWTGVGLAAGGLILASTGAAFIALNDPVKLEEVSNDKVHYTYSEKPLYFAGWTFVGLGTGLLITGAVLTGIYGYKYTHISSDSHEMSFHISPNSLSFGLTF